MSEAIPVALLQRLLICDQEAGKLHWKARTPDLFRDGKYSQSQSAERWNKRYAGHEAMNCLRPDGYLQGTLFGKHYRCHRVLWAVATGKWPVNELDHINGIRSDNRLSNLREVTALENRKNQKTPSDNTSGVIGVSFHSSRKKWRAYICCNRYAYEIGYFDSIDAAIEARRLAEQRHGFHPNHGRANQ